jgi:hypothetical protein
VLRAQLATLFADELAAVAGAERRDLIDALEVAGSWRTWDQLRTEQRCSVARARAVVIRTLSGLLQEHDRASS